MAVTERPSLLPGTVSLVLLRTLVGAVPVLLLASAGAGAVSSLGADPRFSGDTPWAYFQARQVVGDGIAASLSAAPVAAVIVIVLKLFLDAAGFRWLAVRALAQDGHFLPSLVGNGWSWFWAYARLAIPFALLMGAGLFVSRLLNGFLPDPAFPTIYHGQITQNATGASILMVWVLLVANFALWAKAHLALAGSKRALIGAFPMGFLGAFRNPLSSVATFLLLPLPTLAGAALVLWLRGAEPVGLGAGGFTAIGLVVVLSQALVWRLTMGIAIARRAAQFE